ncbi:MAG TPA: hypothetical protein VGD61_19645 [Pyrinomonadaceae bacterium]
MVFARQVAHKFIGSEDFSTFRAKAYSGKVMELDQLPGELNGMFFAL